MASRRPLVLVLAAVLTCTGASYRTQNFIVEAPTPQVAQQIGQYAERYRKEKALEWLGREMPPWPQPCPLKVTVTMGGSGGATSFAFDNGRVLGQHMHIEGSLERLLNSVLPHEVTHTVFAFHFRQPVPRWADEGGAVLSEDDIERNRHDKLCRQILNTPGRAIPLRRLFALREYPSDVMALYAEGFSVANFLVGKSSKPAFLNFVAAGMMQGWDRAVQAHYRYRNVEELEQAWLAHLRSTRQQPELLARGQNPPAPPTDHVVIRQTVPPAQPTLMPRGPIVRGQMDSEGDGNADWSRGQAPAYLPDSYEGSPGHRPTLTSGSPTSPWQPAPETPSPKVQLGLPQYAPPPVGPGHSPVGYPN